MKRVAKLLVSLLSPILGDAAYAQVHPIGDEFLINTYTTSGQQNAAPISSPQSVAAIGDGKFVAVWTSYGQDGDGSGVFGQRLDASGAKIGAEFQVNTYTSGGQTAPVVGADASGNFVVVWEEALGGSQQDGSLSGVFAQRFDSVGQPIGSEFQVNGYTLNKQYQPSIAVAPTGEFVVVWYGEGSGDASGIFARRYDAGGAALGADFKINAYTTSQQANPFVEMDDAGNFVVVWTDFGARDGNGAGAFGRRFASDGTALATDFQVNTFTSADQAAGGVTVDADGDFSVVWWHESLSSVDVYAKRYDSSGTPLDSHFVAHSYRLGDQRVGQVAGRGDGSFVVTWVDYGRDGDSAGVFARGFDADGMPDREFQVNTYTTGFQSYPTAAIGADNEFVVVWSGEGAEDDQGMFGRTHRVAATVLAVTKTTDSNDGSCDADCSLREAVIAANALDGIQNIELGAGVYELTLTGANEDASATGDLDATDSLVITGAGPNLTEIDANGIDRVLDFHGIGSGELRGITVRNGFTMDDGGGVRQAAGVDLTVEDSLITANTAQGHGGGLVAKFSLGVYPTTTLLRTTVAGNTAVSGYGGGVSVTYGTIDRCAIDGNVADAGGGVNVDETLVLSRSTVSGNEATGAFGDGGGILIQTRAYVLNSTVSGNTAAGVGGGIAYGLLQVFNSTIVDNSATGGGGGIWDPGSAANTVIGRNTPDNCGGGALDGFLDSGPEGHNVDDDGSCELALPGDQSNVPDVALGSLADNGGPTLTHAVLVGSPLIGGGDPAACGETYPVGPYETTPGIPKIDGVNDQRGFVRDLDCDVGAVELGASCGGDNDADGVCNLDDNCPNTYNPDQLDSDAGGGGDLCDVCPSDASNTCNIAQSGAEVIDALGGTVAPSGGLFEIEVPTGALSGPTSVSVTSSDDPNFVIGSSGHNVIVVKLEPEGAIFESPVTLRFKWLDEEPGGSECPTGNGLDDDHGELETKFKVWRNGVPITTACLAVACEPGTVCTSATCDACGNELEVQVTEFSEFVLQMPTAAQCPETPSCEGATAAQAKIDFNEKTGGKEKMKLQWRKIAAQTTQGDFGDPVAGSTSVAVCVYDDGGALVQGYLVDRAAQTCVDEDCWKTRGATGYGYADKGSSADGISKLGFSAGDAGKGKADAKGANNGAKGQLALPLGVVAQLAGSVAPTVEMITSDGFCVSATMNEVTKDDATRYSARLK